MSGDVQRSGSRDANKFALSGRKTFNRPKGLLGEAIDHVQGGRTRGGLELLIEVEDGLRLEDEIACGQSFAGLNAQALIDRRPELLRLSAAKFEAARGCVVAFAKSRGIELEGVVKRDTDFTAVVDETVASLISGDVKSTIDHIAVHALTAAKHIEKYLRDGLVKQSQPLTDAINELNAVITSIVSLERQLDIAERLFEPSKEELPDMSIGLDMVLGDPAPITDASAG